MTPARFRWGMVFIMIGVLLLLQNAGVLNSNYWADLLIWFPVVLIAIGVEKIFANSKLKFISYLSTIGLVAVGFLIALTGSYGGQDTSFFSETTFQIDNKPSVKKIEAYLDLDATNLTIRDSGPEIIDGRFDKFTRKPKIYSDFVDDKAIVELKSRKESYLGGAIKINTGATQDWSLRFSREIPLDLSCTGHESDLHLNMKSTPLEQLMLEADNARIYLRLGEMIPLVNIKIFGDHSDLELRVPQNVGLRIAGKDYSAYLLRLDSFEFTEEDGIFITNGFDTIETKIDIELGDNLDNVIIQPF